MADDREDLPESSNASSRDPSGVERDYYSSAASIRRVEMDGQQRSRNYGACIVIVLSFFCSLKLLV